MGKGWGLYVDDGNVHHIIPEDDLEGHVQDLIFPVEPTQWFRDNLEKGFMVVDKGIEFCSDCKCEPQIRWIPERSQWQIVHNSFDGREGVEWVNEILK